MLRATMGWSGYFIEFRRVQNKEIRPQSPLLCINGPSYAIKDLYYLESSYLLSKVGFINQPHFLSKTHVNGITSFVQG